MTNPFQLPITYDTKKVEIQETLKEDLELIKTKNENTKPIYDIVFQPSTTYGKDILEMWSKYYTCNKIFLKDSQTLFCNLKCNLDHEKINIFKNSWKNVIHDGTFLQKFQYIEWNRFIFLNTNEWFLQGMSMYNLTSPVFSLVFPLVALIIPFFILKLMKTSVNFETYKRVLFSQLKNHPIFRIFTNFSQVNNGQKSFMIISLIIYLFNIYQNILTCIKFYSNFNVIHEFFNNSIDYFTYIQEQMTKFLSVSNSLKTYEKFNSNLRNYKSNLESYIKKLRCLQPYKTRDIFKIGKKMKLFYECKFDETFVNTCNYCFGFVGYIDTILGLQYRLTERKMKFGKQGKTTKFKNMHHPALLGQQPIKNSIELNKNFIISGPNASGKTTLLKSILINTLLTQQVYCGFYEKASIRFVDHFHCYLNIPDTNARDSLFQAEARRCKEIIDSIAKYPKKHHFCIFDELYSGTNPFEAVGSAYSYLTYLSENPQVRFMLTTHFLKLCDLVKPNPTIQNIKMKAKIEEQNVNYYYIVEEGISNVKSGFQVLKKLNYPQEILEKVFSFN